MSRLLLCASAMTSIGLCLVPSELQAQVASVPSTDSSKLEISTSEEPNALTRAVVARGALSCAARVDQVSKSLGFGPEAGALFMPPPSQVNNRILALQMELPAGSGSNSFVSMAFAPNQANGCGASYDAVSYWKQSCDSLISGPFAGARKGALLKTQIQVLELGPATKVFLMPAGAGCISIKKEVVL